MASDNTHWVEELFPPSFGLTVDEILKKDKPEEKENTMFDKLASRISPLDVTAIKNVYERVWLMTQIEEEERRKLESSDDEEGWDESGVKFTSTPKSQGRTLSVFQQTPASPTRKRKTKTVNTSTSDIDQQAPLNVADPCIWNTNEINVLRRVFQSAQQQNIRLKAQLQASEEELKKLKGKHKKVSGTADANTEHLQAAVKANQRLDLLAKNLKTQLDNAKRGTSFLEEELRQLKESKRESIKELRDTRIELDSERIEKRRIEIELQNQRKEALREWHLHEDNLKLRHQEDLGYLKKQITKLNQQLDQEKKEHGRTGKALEHLRVHFANLPLSGEAKPRAVISSDQLTKWSY